MVLRDDLAAGRCSKDRRAPMDQWEHLGRLLREASLRPPGDVRSHIYLTRIGVGGDGSATITSLKILSERGSLGQREERIIR
jgi:hypothetical protein